MMRPITEIIIHCSDTNVLRHVSVEEIRSWHRARHFSDIGYHFIIHQDGTIEQGRPISQVGAHCKGHNRFSIGICYVGGRDAAGKYADTRTSAQRSSLVRLIQRLRHDYPSIRSISGHRDFAPKECPCFDAKTEYKYLLQ